jgi:branched-chain amino acid transport system permease protein
VGVDVSVLNVLQNLGFTPSAALAQSSPFQLTPAQLAPMLPFVLMVAVLVLRPQGLMGRREN